MRHSLVPSSLLLLAVSGAAQGTVNVDSSMPMPMIQQIIDTSGPNTTVAFAAGTYQGSLVVTQDIVLRGAGAATTTIDAQNAMVPVLRFVPGITRNTVVSGFRVTRGRGDQTTSAGGGIHCVDAAPIVRDCVVVGNVASFGGGVYAFGQLANGRSLLMEDCQILANRAYQAGGAILVGKTQDAQVGAAAHFVRCTITDNAAFDDLANPTSGNGGGAAVRARSAPVFERCVFRENVAYLGGGIDWSDGSAPYITNCAIDANGATSGGGIRYFSTGAAVIEHTSVTNNAAIGTGQFDGGGGMAGWLDSEFGGLTVRNSLFAYNQSVVDGGAILVNDSAPKLRFVTIADNFSLGASSSGTGGLYYLYSTQTTTRFEMRNSIVWGNTGQASASQLATQLAGINLLPQFQPLIEWSDVQFGVSDPTLLPPSSGNIDADPLFVAGYTCDVAPVGLYFLSQAPQGVAHNPCVDTARAAPTAPAIAGRTTRTDGVPDGGAQADRGFHYPPPGCQ